MTATHVAHGRRRAARPARTRTAWTLDFDSKGLASSITGLFTLGLSVTPMFGLIAAGPGMIAILLGVSSIKACRSRYGIAGIILGAVGAALALPIGIMWVLVIGRIE